MSAMKYQAHSIVVGAAMLTMAVSAGATPPDNGYEIVPSEGNTIPWPTTILGSPGAFRRIVLGEFAGSAIPGALALVGNRAVYLFEPAVHKDITEIASSGVNDIATLAPASPGLPAGMVLAKTDGLYIASLDINIEPGTTGSGTIQTVQIAAGNFADLDLVRTGKINSSGCDDIVGANGANIYVLLESGSGWAAGPSFQAPSTVRDMVVLPWNGAGDGDIAILLDQSVEIRESDGDVIETQLGVANGGFLAHVPPTSANSAERLAWSLALPSPSTTHALVTLTYPNTRTGCGVFSQAPGALLSAILKDSEGETRVDLLTSKPLDPEVQIYHHRPSGPPYAAALPDPSLTFDVGTTVVAGDGPPAFGDFTLDGIPDTIAGRGASHEFFIVPGKPPTMAELPLDVVLSDAVLLMDGQATPQPWFGFTVGLPENAENYDYVQTILWWSQDGDDLEPGAIQNLAFGGGQLDSEVPVEVWLPLTGVVAGICAEDFGVKGFAITLRLVTWDGQSATVSGASSPLHGIFAWHPDTIEAMASDSPYTTIGWSSPCGEPGIGLTPVASLPPKRTGSPPSVPQIEEGTSPPQ